MAIEVELMDSFSVWFIATSYYERGHWYADIIPMAARTSEAAIAAAQRLSVMASTKEDSPYYGVTWGPDFHVATRAEVEAFDHACPGELSKRAALVVAAAIDAIQDQQSFQHLTTPSNN